MIKFVDYDSETILASLIARFEEATGETLQPSDERRIFINQLAQVIVAQNATINDAANQALLRYARGDALDAIGSMFGVTRLEASYATTMLKFTLSTARTTTTIIPAGTRATPDGKLHFATVKDLIIPTGELVGTVEAQATTAGLGGNGFVAGQIKYVTDNTPYLSSVENTTTSAGGMDKESDDNYRERIRIAPESFSTAGCEDGYIYHAKSVAGIGDVSVTSPSAGTVKVCILKEGGIVPETNDQLLTEVYEKLSARNVRPLTDYIEVVPPTVVNYAINLEYWVSSADASNVAGIDTNVNKAIEEYIAWQDTKIGRDINPDKLRNLVLNAGASRVTITHTYTELSNDTVAKVSGTPAITYKGLSE